MSNLPLVGLKILEIGHYIAAPFCTRILADLGAEVIKLEPPGGDPFRGWGAAKDGTSVWFSIHGRNNLTAVPHAGDRCPNQLWLLGTRLASD